MKLRSGKIVQKVCKQPIRRSVHSPKQNQTHEPPTTIPVRNQPAELICVQTAKMFKAKIEESEKCMLVSLVKPLLEGCEDCLRNERCIRISTIFHILDTLRIWKTSGKFAIFRPVLAKKIHEFLNVLVNPLNEFEVELREQITSFRQKYNTDQFFTSA